MRFVRLLAAGLVAGIVLASLSVGLIVPPALAATISDPLDVSDISHLDFETPKNAGAWKTTVPASVLKGAGRIKKPGPGGATVKPVTPNKNSALLAAQSRQTRAAAALSRSNGPSVSTWTTVQRTAPKVPEAIASVKSKFVVPATSLTTAGKVLPGIGAALAMWEGMQTGFQVGKGVSNMIGFDAAQGLCAPTFADNGIIAGITGTDCSAFLKMSAALKAQANAAAEGFGTPTGEVCSVVGCVKWANSPAFESGANAYVRSTWCVAFTGSVSAYNVAAKGWGIDKDGAISHLQTNQTFCPSGQERIYFRAADASTPYIKGFRITQNGTELVRGNTAVNMPNPSRTLECVIAGSDAVTYRKTSAPFTEGDGVTAQPKCPALPDGVSAQNIKVLESGDVGGPAEVFNEDTTPEYRALEQAYPECMGGLCFADLRKVVAGSATGTLSCFDDLNDSDCIDWFKDPNKVDVYQCHYAGKLTSLSECQHYVPTFDSAKRAQGIVYSDPETGVDAPAGTAPTGDNPMNTPVLDPEKPRNCFPTGWAALNPVNWVVQPVGCALEKAFVARPSVVTARLEAIKLRWNGTQPAKLILAVGGIAPALSTLEDGGCGGIPIDLSGIAPGIIPPTTGTFLPACAGDFFHPWAIGIKLFLIGGLTLGGFFAIKAQVSRLVGLSGSA